MCKLICCCSYKRHHYHWCLCMDSATIPWQHGKQIFKNLFLWRTGFLTWQYLPHHILTSQSQTRQCQKPWSATERFKAVRKGFKMSRQKLVSRTCGPCNAAIIVPRHHGTSKANCEHILLAPNTSVKLCSPKKKKLWIWTYQAKKGRSSFCK